MRQCCLQRKAGGYIYLGVWFQSQGKPLLSHTIAFIHLFSPSIFPTFHWIYLAENQEQFCGKQYFRKVSKMSTTGMCIQYNHPTLECACRAVLSLSVVSDSLRPVDCSPPSSSVHGDSPGKNTGVGGLFLLQVIFLTKKSNWGLLHCRQNLNQLSYQGGPYLIRWTPLKEGLEIRERSQRFKATETDIFLLALMQQIAIL